MSNYGPKPSTGGAIKKRCPTCGKRFFTNDNRQVYCSVKCKRRAQNKRYYAAHRDKIIQKARERSK